MATTTTSRTGSRALRELGSEARRLWRWVVRQDGIVGLLERAFYRHGLNVATKPWKYIGWSLGLVAFVSLGLVRFNEESYGVRLWLSPASELRRNHDWLLDNHPRDIRVHSLLLFNRYGETVLTPRYLREMAHIRSKVENAIRTSRGFTWSGMCKTIPALNSTNLSDRVYRQLFRFGEASRQRRTRRSLPVVRMAGDNNSTSNNASNANNASKAGGAADEEYE